MVQERQCLKSGGVLQRILAICVLLQKMSNLRILPESMVEGSTTAHNEILQIIDSSSDYRSFVKGLRNWADNRLVGGAEHYQEN